MLVLTRSIQESLKIGDDVQITVVEIIGQKVRLGITAPNQVPVYRNEIYEKIRQERGKVSRPVSPLRDRLIARSKKTEPKPTDDKVV